MGTADNGDIPGFKCRDLTSEESRQRREYVGVLISRQKLINQYMYETVSISKGCQSISNHTNF